MRHVFSFFVALLLGSALSGCIRVSTHVTVRPDGGGNVTERVLMNMAFMKTMMNGSGDAKSNMQTASSPDRKALEKSAAAMGDGVRLKSFRHYQEGDFEGYEAVYSFSDINRLKVSGRPDESLASDSLAKGGTPAAREPILFRFRKGVPSTLVIVMPEEKSLLEPASKSSTPSKPPTPEQQKLSLAIIREVFKGTRMTLSVGVDGSLVSTNAVCREGSRIILADVDFDRLLGTENQDSALLNLTGYGSSPDSLTEMLNRVSGLRGETGREVTVLFN
ncbi:MAG: hypothetical protein K9G39_00270 [Chlorobium sp.]|uniref:hypothetical protein n=1 Tax=Chlorobium sp. TaxID=1095 RepID=UPI0025BC2DC8|nr:hypothetical protein [Chlorobium sp.]MCF8382021.1 hypothetical protein [Chlorobium sp.]